MVTAHRGSSYTAPENTLRAIELAVTQGADYVEIDVRRAADGTLVLLHDLSLRRVTGIPRNLRDVRYRNIRDRALPPGYGAATVGERVPTLAAAIEQVRGRAGLYLDVKYDPATPEVVPELVALLQRHDAVAGTYVASTHRRLLQRVARLEPGLSLAWLANVGFGAVEMPDGLDALALRAAQATNKQAIAARRGGYQLHVWTVNRPGHMARMIDLGVDNIITDRPGLLRSLIKQTRGLPPPSLGTAALERGGRVWRDGVR